MESTPSMDMVLFINWSAKNLLRFLSTVLFPWVSIALEAPDW